MTMERARPAVRRCAIYARKSPEEGLEQGFNSLHAPSGSATKNWRAKNYSLLSFLEISSSEPWSRDPMTTMALGLRRTKVRLGRNLVQGRQTMATDNTGCTTFQLSILDRSVEID
jgi:hypothetical protein